jgi:hypothetical protein
VILKALLESQFVVRLVNLDQDLQTLVSDKTRGKDLKNKRRYQMKVEG